MRISKQLTFLYMPSDHARVRQMNVPRGVFLLTLLAMISVLLMAGFYVVGVWRGSSWLPGGSLLARENAQLRQEISRLEQQVSHLRQDLAQVYEIQELVSVAVGLDPLDPDVWEAGVGGRAPLDYDFGELDLSQLSGRLQILEQELDKLMRQARIQTQGSQAILDTLSARKEVREHLPSIRPVDTGWLSSGFGKRNDPFTGRLAYHHGIDFSVPIGTPVRATADGIISAVKQEPGFGRVVKIAHGNGVETVYAHLSKFRVEKGQKVGRGAIIAESGKSGRVTAAHLHYEIRVDNRRVNPLSFILDSYATR